MAKILVADDSETILLLVRTRLEMEGHEVETAADGQEVVEAVHRAGDSPPDILLLDAMMPRKSGTEALRELRAAGIETPALIVSAHTDGGNGENGAELAISGYIAKPIDFDQLFKKIAELTAPGPAD
ncbi:MAG TPA: response regulator [Solirubrobacterales bacterium]|nr:response regulator [Solirubrobacterales bacterium]